MKSKKSILLRFGILTLIALTLTACVRVPKDWYGKSTHHLFRVYGYPDRIARLRDGWCMLIYQKSDSTCKMTFRVDSHRMIRAVRYEHCKT